MNYRVNETYFSTFLPAVAYARSIGADVFEVKTGQRRWTPAKKSAQSKTVHVFNSISIYK